jgi:uncharacterized protein YbbK (DUF523 family)
MERILVSACLLGQPVRYDGTGKRSDDALFELWRSQGRLVPICPEVGGGLPVPRPAAEICGGFGEDVLDGRASVLTRDGTDVTQHFVAGAWQALERARSHGIRLAILKEGSPSCGSLHVFDGTFGDRKVPGEGVTTALLERHGIDVFAEDAMAAVAARLAELAARHPGRPRR